jgi:hypothetical protein
MDKIIEKITGIGVPVLILILAISTNGLAGAAAITLALSSLGGPFGMLGGIGLLGISILISQSISKYGFSKVFSSTVKKLIEKGETKESILEKIDKYPISKELKLKLKNLLEK